MPECRIRLTGCLHIRAPARADARAGSDAPQCTPMLTSRPGTGRAGRCRACGAGREAAAPVAPGDGPGPRPGHARGALPSGQPLLGPGPCPGSMLPGAVCCRGPCAPAQGAQTSPGPAGRSGGDVPHPNPCPSRSPARAACCPARCTTQHGAPPKPSAHAQGRSHPPRRVSDVNGWLSSGRAGPCRACGARRPSLAGNSPGRRAARAAWHRHGRLTGAAYGGGRASAKRVREETASRVPCQGRMIRRSMPRAVQGARSAGVLTS